MNYNIRMRLKVKEDNMVVEYLEKIRDKFQTEMIELNISLSKCQSTKRENSEIIKLLEVNDDPYFEAFSPRPVSSFNKTKITELREEQKILEVEILSLETQIREKQNEIDEVNNVIKAAKECIF